MRKLLMFNLVTADGYFEGPNHDISWHNVDEEFNEFAIPMIKAADTLLFGRVTYELMANYWPSPQALRDDPIVAERMNNASKVVFSKTLVKVDWKNTRLVKENMEEEVTKLKALPGKSITLLGSGSIVTQLAERGLIDEYQILVNPVVLGDGTPLFKGINKRLTLKLTQAKTFKSGNVFMSYKPAKQC